MDPLIQPLITLGSAVAIVITIIFFNQRTARRIDDTRIELKGDIQRNSDKIDATRELLRAEFKSDIADSRKDLKTEIVAAGERAHEANDLVRDLRGDVLDLRGDVRVVQQQVRRVEEKIDERERIGA